MHRVLLCLIPFVWSPMGAGCGPVCTENDECAVGAYCTTEGECETKSCEPSEGNTLGPEGYVRFCQCVGDILQWETGADDGACTYGCELTWTPHTSDCAAAGRQCRERVGVSERPVVGCM